MDIAKMLEAMAPPVRMFGKGLLGIGIAAIGTDVTKGAFSVPLVTIVALTSVGAVLWMLANLAETNGSGKAKKGKRRRRK